MVVISLKDVVNNITTRFIKHGKLDKSPSLDEIKKYLPQAIELCSKVCRNRDNVQINKTKSKTKSKSKSKSKFKPTKK